MRGLLVTGVLCGWASLAAAEPPRPACSRTADSIVAVVIGAGTAADKLRPQVARRCDHDRWSREVQSCFGSADSAGTAQKCLETLTKDQLRQVEGDADRITGLDGTGAERFAYAAYAHWAFRRHAVARAAAPQPVGLAPPVMKAQLVVDAPDAGRARLFHTQGISAYQAGRYDVAVKNFNAALATNPSPELLYQIAQAYRLKGERGKAVELYERYLDVSPHGPAAPDCHAQLDKLRDTP